MTRKLIILTDPGQDQAAAILMILGQPQAFDVLGLVATAGNIQLDHTINNCLKLMELAGRPDGTLTAGMTVADWWQITDRPRNVFYGHNLATGPDARIIDGRGKLVMPGLVNSHTHSSETFFRGLYQGMPLEIWLLYAYPLLMNGPIGERLLYLRSLLLAMESLRNGVTTSCDPGSQVKKK